jgi:hypothetical protein
MDSIKDVLLAKNLDQPSEMKAIEVFLEREIPRPFSVREYPRHITIGVSSGKVAYLVRTRLTALEAFAAPTKKIHIRIDPSLS